MGTLATCVGVGREAASGGGVAWGVGGVGVGGEPLSHPASETAIVKTTIAKELFFICFLPMFLAQRDEKQPTGGHPRSSVASYGHGGAACQRRGP